MWNRTAGRRFFTHALPYRHKRDNVAISELEALEPETRRRIIAMLRNEVRKNVRNRDNQITRRS